MMGDEPTGSPVAQDATQAQNAARNTRKAILGATILASVVALAHQFGHRFLRTPYPANARMKVGLVQLGSAFFKLSQQL